MSEMGIDQYEPEKWRNFIDSSKTSLKAVLLYENSTIKPVPVLYAIKKKENYETMGWILKTLNYSCHGWRACCDLKVVTFLLVCNLDILNNVAHLVNSRFSGNQYKKRDWEPRTFTSLGQFNQISPPLMHIKLGIVKSFIKTLVKPSHPGKHPRNIPAFNHLNTHVFQNYHLKKLKKACLMDPI
ncbi:unnamed protein product [Brassicogethes aeneus]|uniref:Uncharacterized protein n=1 Tax=Brassicogethes aeneus TaxID=1431903 RepID=A0A9P0FKE8_BRAAE|nr:unnamed protein product [Brassicogethes aeneus]